MWLLTPHPHPQLPWAERERCRFLPLGKKVMKCPVLVAKQRNSVEGKPGPPVSAQGLALPTAWRQGCLGPPSPVGGGAGHCVTDGCQVAS